ncbi:hypothetical protein JZ751_008531 [Albula glossodonta]|uniref:Uncharacterized protein n=1 Tax=Albula glossodonta TaxID=121402 RepID=A0A8T2N926_9TELE|nr:hypothetical protein JZ751_008531 [Albula glossodonta]
MVSRAECWTDPQLLNTTLHLEPPQQKAHLCFRYLLKCVVVAALGPAGFWGVLVCVGVGVRVRVGVRPAALPTSSPLTLRTQLRPPCRRSLLRQRGVLWSAADEGPNRGAAVESGPVTATSACHHGYCCHGALPMYWQPLRLQGWPIVLCLWRAERLESPPPALLPWEESAVGPALSLAVHCRQTGQSPLERWGASWWQSEHSGGGSCGRSRAL